MLKTRKIKLQQYATFAIAFIGLTDAKAKVVYTDVDPDIILNDDVIATYIDMDNNGINDFWLWNLSYYTSYAGHGPYSFERIWAGAFGNVSNGIAGTASFDVYPKTFPYALSLDIIINEDLNFYTSYWQTMALKLQHEGTTGGGMEFSWTRTAGNWFPQSENHFLGVRFLDDESKFHYGWIRCSVLDSGSTLIIKDYAYERFADSAIVAGDKIGIIPNITFNPDLLNTEIGDFVDESVGRIYTYNTSVFVNLFSQTIDGIANIYNLSGELLHTQELNSQFTEIQLVNPKGVYFVELIIDQSRYVQKVVIN